MAVSTTTSTSHTQVSPTVASTATVTLEAVLLAVQSLIGPKTMVAASKRQLGMMMWVVATMAVTVAMAVCLEEPSSVLRSILLMVRMLTSPLGATMQMGMAKQGRCNPKVP